MASKKAPSRDGKFQGEAVNGFVWDEKDGWLTDNNADGVPDGFKVATGAGYDSAPDRDGRFHDEVIGQYKWDNGVKKWDKYVGRDRTQLENIPADHEHLGDGSPENPHRIVPVNRW